MTKATSMLVLWGSLNHCQKLWIINVTITVHIHIINDAVNLLLRQATAGPQSIADLIAGNVAIPVGVQHVESCTNIALVVQFAQLDTAQSPP